MIPVDPYMTVLIEDCTVGLKGFVVIHTLGQCGAGGGIRCAPDVTVEEVRLLARAMTHKYSFFCLPHGGGKGGMVLAPDTPPDQRRQLVDCLGQHLGLLLRSGAYSPWTDMNFDMADLNTLCAGAGVAGRDSFEETSAYRTALSTFASVQAAADALHIPPHRCRVTIEGFGAVGGTLAEEIVAWGGSVVGVSNLEGAIAHADGLPLAEVLARRTTFGPAFIRRDGPWRKLARQDLFAVETDIFVPCARVLSLTEAIARQLPARAVVPAANVPCNQAAEAVLNARGILLLPDFVVNAGGVLGMMQGPDGRAFFLDEFKRMVVRLIEAAAASNTPPVALATRVANENYRNRNDDFFARPSLGSRVLTKLQFRGLVPNRAQATAMQQRQRIRQLAEGYFHSAGPVPG